MANEKSRNHDTKGGNGGASKHQGKSKDQTEPNSKASDTGTGPGNDSQGGESKDE